MTVASRGDVMFTMKLGRGGERGVYLTCNVQMTVASRGDVMFTMKLGRRGERDVYHACSVQMAVNTTRADGVFAR